MQQLVDYTAIIKKNPSILGTFHEQKREKKSVFFTQISAKAHRLCPDTNYHSTRQRQWILTASQ